MRHTPGPWEVITEAKSKLEQKYLYVLGSDKHKIARLNGGNRWYANPSQHPNARLIAAAPGMYDALKAIADTKIDGSTDHAQLCALLIAIAKTELGKAEGRT